MEILQALLIYFTLFYLRIYHYVYFKNQQNHSAITRALGGGYLSAPQPEAYEQIASGRDNEAQRIKKFRDDLKRANEEYGLIYLGTDMTTPWLRHFKYPDGTKETAYRSMSEVPGPQTPKSKDYWFGLG